MWPFKKNYKKKSRGGGAAPAGSPTPPGPFGGKRRVLRAAEGQLLGPQVPDPGGRGLTGRRWRAARREQAGGPTEGATWGRGLCPRDEPPSTTWPRKPRPERGGAASGTARSAPASETPASETPTRTACHGLPRGASGPTARTPDSHPGPPASAGMARFPQGRADGRTRSRCSLLGGAVTPAAQPYLFPAQGRSLELCSR